MKKKINNSGISLVEMMVTVAIFAVLVGALYSGFSAGSISWRTYENNIATQREARQALLNMRRELREASGISITQDSDSATISFTRTDVGGVTYSWSTTGGDANKIIRQFGGVDTVLANSISALSFTSDATSVTINITATKSSTGGQPGTFNLVEKVALRG